MIPRSITRNLAGLRWRERLIRLVWGACRFAALVLALLVVACLIDYAIDRDRDTPWTLRCFLTATQVAAAIGAGVLFVLWPQMRRLRNPELALWVEEQYPRLQHRLISAVELNQPGADVEGMSEELIAVVTREAEKQTSRVRFADVADHRRLIWSGAVFLPVAFLAAVLFAIWPMLTLVLLGRQTLLDLEVPRLVQLEAMTPEVLPVGEKFQILYRVTGPVDESTVGTVVVSPEGQPRDRYELKWLRELPSGDILFGADVPPTTADLTYSARLLDGRTRTPGRIEFVSRPIVTKQYAWVQLPTFCGKTPDGNRYEVPQQGHGDVVGIAGSSVRVAMQTSKPIQTADLELWDAEQSQAGRAGGVIPEPEPAKHLVQMKIGDSGQNAEAVFDLKPGWTAYRIVVTDEYGFENVPAPRRSLRMVPEEPPQVVLLKDYFGSWANSEIDGIPITPGKAIRIPYVCHGPYGLGQARILYRVLPKVESGENAVEPGPWTVLPLPEVTSSPNLGPFDPKRGVFAKSRFDDEVPFHAVPSLNPALVMGRQLGGGRYFLRSSGLIDHKGKAIEIKRGDQIEYCVEVFADRDTRAGRPSARSEPRVASVVSEDEFDTWFAALLREQDELQKLEKGQRSVLEK